MTKEELKNTRVAITDADSIPHIISYNHKDLDDVNAVLENVDDFIHTILQAVQCRKYIGVLSYKVINNIEPLNFRHGIAVSYPYKGQRSEKPEWYQKWAPYIEQHMIDKWGFIRAPFDIEADDLVVALHQNLPKLEKTCTTILCHNDKDCRQSSGHLYDFRKNVGEFITVSDASYNLFYQVLMGDRTDNIGGLAGCGKVGAAKILGEEGLNEDSYALATLYAYMGKLGMDQGIQRFHENYMLCKMREDLPVEHIELVDYDLEAGAERTKYVHDDTPGALEAFFDGIDRDGAESIFKIEDDE